LSTEFDLIIKDGMIVDGTGMPRYRADVGIRDGRVIELGQLATSNAAEIIDAAGCIVAPGFIDLHTHYDAQLFWDPFCSISGWHGVTTVVIGNCGFGFAPVSPSGREHAMRSMTRNEAISYDAMEAGLPWDWESFPEFLDSVARTPKAINVVPLAPLGPALIEVLGLERAKAGVLPSDHEHAALESLLDVAMDAGAWGWSAQRMLPDSGLATQLDHDGTPMVTDVMHDITCIRMAEVLGRRRAGFIQMTLKTGDIKRDQAHFEDLATASGRPVLYNTLGVVERAPEAHRETIAWLDRCRSEGLRVVAQAVTSTFGFTFTLEDFNLFDDSPPWRAIAIGPRSQRLAMLADPAHRELMRSHLPSAATAGVDAVRLVHACSPSTVPFEGLSMAEIGQRQSCSAADALIDIALADELSSTFYVDAASTSIDLINEIVQYSWAVPGISDGGAHTKFLTAGRYPTELIIEFARDRDYISLEAAHWRLSKLPALVCGLHDRGTIEVGHPADIIVYDLSELEILPAVVTYDLPGGDWRRVQRAAGYRHVIVNGCRTMCDDQALASRPGELLRSAGRQGSDREGAR
jgi:N-acyl-D-amino-acid deacylase